ncbi:MAG TPA: TraX family protein [Beijerinckiaceae bacterium]|jgi:uncharacterized membrane protein
MLQRIAAAPATIARPAVSTTDLWKFAGVTLLLVDHYGLFFDEDQDWWRVAGRIAAPIFFFLIGYARTRQVPASWIVWGLVLTAVDTWTSGEGLGKINLNILINFALVRLLLPEVESRVMGRPVRVALLVLAIILLIRPFQQVLEYGAQGWLWALFGLAHRLAAESRSRLDAALRDGVAFATALAYTGKEIIDYEFALAEGIALAVLVGIVTIALARFRRADAVWSPPEPIAGFMRFCGRHSLQIYAVTLLAMQILAYALDLSEE